MDLDDRITIQTPEGVELELTLAGLGSRASASIIDSIIKGAVLVAVLLFGWFLGRAGENNAALAAGFISIVILTLFIGYDIAFEVLNNGRTPGKRVTGIRVVTSGGGPVRFAASTIRNVLRVVDFLPGLYFVGIMTIFLSVRHQRVGDLAASTLVIRDRLPAYGTPPIESPGGAAVDVGAWDVSGIGSRELAVIRQFLERRLDLDWDTRNRIADRIAAPLRERVVGPHQSLDSEQFLERVAEVKAHRG